MITNENESSYRLSHLQFFACVSVDSSSILPSFVDCSSDEKINKFKSNFAFPTQLPYAVFKLRIIIFYEPSSTFHITFTTLRRTHISYCALSPFPLKLMLFSNSVCLGAEKNCSNFWRVVSPWQRFGSSG